MSATRKPVGSTVGSRLLLMLLVVGSILTFVPLAGTLADAPCPEWEDMHSCYDVKTNYLEYPCEYGTCLPSGQCTPPAVGKKLRITNPPSSWSKCRATTGYILGYWCNETLFSCGTTTNYSDTSCVYDCPSTWTWFNCAANAGRECGS